MKAIEISILCILLLSGSAMAQDLDAPNNEELNNQKETQVKYHLKHIALLQTYLGFLKKGYDIVQKGLTVVGDIKDGSFKLHQGYVGELQNVKPVIARSVKVAQILSAQRRMMTQFSEAIDNVRETNMFTAQELTYLQDVRRNVVNACNSSLDELSGVITSGSFVMRDDERLARIDKIYLDTQERYGFVKEFTGQAMLLAAQRDHEHREVLTMEAINDMP